MNILVPKNVFLRVEDKFSPDFIDNDADVSSDPTLLYKKIFKASSNTGKCTLPQKWLSSQCKFSLRTLQYSLHCLTDLEYLHVEHNPGGPNTYVLLLSEHVREMLKDCECIDRSDWYPRDEQETATAPVATVPEPMQEMQGGYAPPAHPSYNVDKNNKNTTPPYTPLPATDGCATAPEPHAGRGLFSPVQGGSILAAFERLWSVWPVKQSRYGALRAFTTLARAGRLPALPILLTAVERHREQDDRWQRGYAPHLVNWLNGHRWLDTPVTRTGTTAAPPVPVATPSIPALSGEQIVPAPCTAIAARSCDPVLQETLAAIVNYWPDENRIKIMASLIKLHGRGKNIKLLFENTVRYVKETTRQISFNDWISKAMEAC